MKKQKGIITLILALFIGFGGYEFVAQPQNAIEEIQSDAHFRNSQLLEEHYEKHGRAMGYENAQAYQEGAQAVISNRDALKKYEAEDQDLVYYLEATNEIVFVSQDGVIRTYFNPDDGIDYYNRQ